MLGKWEISMHTLSGEENKIMRNPLMIKKFTLVELLVVIAIIGILTAMLLPAIKGAKDFAVHAACQNQLKQQSLAIMMYGNDIDGHWPTNNSNYSNDFRALCSVLVECMPPTGTPVFGYKTSVFTGYLCPATERYWGFKKLADGSMDDDDTGDLNNHLAFGGSKIARGNGPGCYRTSLTSKSNAPDSTTNGRWISAYRMDDAGSKKNGGTYFNTDPSFFIMISDRGFTSENNIGDVSDHGDGKWNSVFLDGHVQHFTKNNNQNRNYKNEFSLDSSLR